ncbi:MAG: diguanylate cyclase [Candidatus Eremiobacterota bacterium]
MDDTTLSLKVAARVVEAAGHEVVLAMDGRSALEKFHVATPDLILLDVVLPDLDGYEVARRIRGLCEQGEGWLPIIFLSGLVEEDDVVRGIEAGGDDYLLKPVRPKILRAKLQAMERIARMRHDLCQANRKLESLSLSDPLTGIANRRRLDQEFMREWRRAARLRTPVSLILCDVDHFKRYNDHFGHPQGDECLRQVAQALAGAARRPADLAARYGGEEFAVVLADTDLDGAAVVAERIRVLVRSLGLPHPLSSVPDRIVTVSVGVATAWPAPGGGLPESLVDLADEALYRAKSDGRDRVVLQDERLRCPGGVPVIR